MSARDHALGSWAETLGTAWARIVRPFQATASRVASRRLLGLVSDGPGRGGPDAAYWARPVEALFADLGSSPAGVSRVEAGRRLQEFGPNRVQEQRNASAVTILLRQLRSPLVLILVFAGVLAGALQEWINAGIILAMVSGSTLLGFFQEHRASHAVESLRRRLSLVARVRRDGELVSIPFSEIVPGDVVSLAAGAIVPADAVVFCATDLLISQASLTGESCPVEKRPGVVSRDAGVTDRENCAFAGSSVRSGTGEALVIRTGRGTEFGAIAEHLQGPPVESGFALGVRRFGLLLLQVMFATVLFVLIVNQLLGRPFIDSLLFSVALGLGMSPELLPAIVSVTLSAGAVQLARKGVIVRQLEAIENLGGMTVFCTDKTGTLTEGEIRMQGALGCDGRSNERVRWLGFLNAATEAGIRNPLDRAIVEDGEAAGLKLDGVLKLGEVPYDFTRKRLSVVVEDREAPGQVLMVLKGAVEHVLDRCETVTIGGQEIALTSQTLAHLHDFASAKAVEGLRLLAVATRRLPPQPTYCAADEARMRLEGFLVFLDPPKAEAVAAIAELRRLQVGIKVLSGDNRHVVRHVAEQVGLREARLLTGEDLAHLDGVALSAAAEQATLFAEVDPQQKERIVRALRGRGEVVGYLGDGINDAPALYAADVGVSVDQAVDVARESADVVLLRRDLSVLRDGVLGGRRSFVNTLKYINITTSANFGNMVSMALAAPLLPFLPMAAKQILLNNLLSDLPALAISTDRVDAESLVRAQRLDTGQLRRFMIVFGLISSVFDLAAFAVLLQAFHATEVRFQTAWFVLSLLTELVALFALRTHAPAWRSAPSRVLLAASLCVAVAAIALPHLGLAAILFGFEPLGPSMLISVAGLVIGYFAATEWTKEAIFGSRAAQERAHPVASVTRRRRPF